MDWVPLIVAVLGAGGIGAAAREIVNALMLASRGVSGREDKRRTDLVGARDWAVAQAQSAAAEAAQMREELEQEIRQRQFYQEQLAVLRRVLIGMGGDPGDWPSWDTEQL